MGLREWVILLAIILMIVVAADAWRRVKRQRRYHGQWVRPGDGTTGSRNDASVKVSRVSGEKSPRTGSAAAGRSAASSTEHTASRASPVASANRQTAPRNAGEKREQGEQRMQREPHETVSKTEQANQEPISGAAAAAEPPPSAMPEQDSPADTRSASVPNRKPLDLSKKVPMLVDSVDTEEDTESSAVPEVPENQFEFDLRPPEPKKPQPDTSMHDADADTDHDDYDDDDVLMSGAASDYPGASDHSAEAPIHSSDDPFADLYDEPTAWEQTLQDDVSPVPSSVDEDDQLDETDDQIQDPALEAADSRQMADAEVGEQLLAEPEEVLVITVLAREGVEFEGANLLSIMLACGMRFGRMNIFHATDDHGRLQYSAANAYNPGTFDLDDLDNFSTRGVTFFLQLPCQSNPLDAFEAMVQAANTLGTHMDGDVVDESRSVMTAQTLTHYRERIRDHQRAQLVRRA